MTGATPDELLAPDCPVGFEYIWAWFLRLNSTRPSGFTRSPGVSEQEIRAFFTNRRITPEVWEIELIARLDRVALASEDQPKER